MKTTGDLFENLKNVIKSTFKEEIDVFRAQRAINDMALIEKSLLNDSKYYFEELTDFVNNEVLENWVDNYYYAKIAKLKSEHLEFVFYSYKVLEGILDWWLNEAKGIKYINDKQREVLENNRHLAAWSKNKLFREILVNPLINKDGKSKKGIKISYHQWDFFNFYKNLRDRFSHGVEIEFTFRENPNNDEKITEFNNKYSSYWDEVLENDRLTIKKLYKDVENYNLAMKQALIHNLIHNASK